MRTILKILGPAGAALIGLTACGDNSTVSGRYVAEIQGSGMKMELNFHEEGKATLTMSEDGNGEDMECAYESGEKRIAVNCFGSSGISLTRLDDGDLEGDMGGTIVRYKKR